MGLTAFRRFNTFTALRTLGSLEALEEFIAFGTVLRPLGALTAFIAREAFKHL